MEYSLNDKWLRLLGIPLSVPLATLAQMPFFYPGRWDLWWKFTLAGLFFTVLMWEAGRWMILTVRRRWPGVQQTVTRILWTFLGWVVVVSAGHSVMLWSIDCLQISPFKVFTLIGLRNNVITSFAFWAVLGAVYEAIYFSQNYRLALLRAEQLRKEQARRKLDALKNRVNPHFLFNSLTTLSALIGEDPKLAERFVDELSKVYRYLLRANQLHSVSLADEIAFAEAYCFLLKTRFEHIFSLKIDITAEYHDKKLPPATLRTLLDHLVRTQKIEAEYPLHLELSADAGGLILVGAHQPKTVWFDSGDQEWEQIRDSFAGRARPATQTISDGKIVLRLPYLHETQPVP